jgi:hypothetical protein
MLIFLLSNKKTTRIIFISSIKELSRLYLEYNKYKETIITKRLRFKFQIFINSSYLFLSGLTMTCIVMKLNNKLN